MKHITIEIQSDLGNVSLAAVAVNAICLQGGFDADQSNQIELCIAEALTNVIRHAYRGEADRKVAIEVAVGRGQLRLEVRDEGVAMPPGKIEKLVNGERFTDQERIDLKHLSEGGRGLQIIRSVMDEVVYSRDGATNRLTLTKRTSAS